MLVSWNDSVGKQIMSVYQVVWLQSWQGQQIRNTFYYETDVGDPTNSEWQDIVDEIRADLAANWAARCNSSWVFRGITARRVDVIGLLSREFTPTAGDLAGTHVGDAIPSQIAVLVSNKGTTTKPNRTRTYLAGSTDGEYNGSTVQSTLRNAAETLIDLQSNLNAGGTNPLTRVSAAWNTAHTQVLNWNDISGASSVASTVAATQRRRRVGVGI